MQSMFFLFLSSFSFFVFYLSGLVYGVQYREIENIDESKDDDGTKFRRDRYDEEKRKETGTGNPVKSENEETKIPTPQEALADVEKIELNDLINNPDYTFTVMGVGNEGIGIEIMDKEGVPKFMKIYFDAGDTSINKSFQEFLVRIKDNPRRDTGKTYTGSEWWNSKTGRDEKEIALRQTNLRNAQIIEKQVVAHVIGNAAYPNQVPGIDQMIYFNGELIGYVGEFAFGKQKLTLAQAQKDTYTAQVIDKLQSQYSIYVDAGAEKNFIKEDYGPIRIIDATFIGDLD